MQNGRRSRCDFPFCNKEQGFQRRKILLDAGFDVDCLCLCMIICTCTGSIQRDGGKMLVGMECGGQCG